MYTEDPAEESPPAAHMVHVVEEVEANTELDLPAAQPIEAVKLSQSECCIDLIDTRYKTMSLSSLPAACTPVNSKRSTEKKKKKEKTCEES